MLKRNHRRIDEALWQHHFQDILSNAQQKSEFQLKNTFYEFIPTSSSSQLGKKTCHFIQQCMSKLGELLERP